MKKTIITVIATLVAMSACNTAKQENTTEMKGYTDMEAIETILARKSVRSFLPTAVEQEKIDLMLRAGMAAPSAMDRRPWEIVVVSGREAMDKLAEQLPYAAMLKEAPLAIIVCGDTERSEANWHIDCSAVTENILLAAEALGLGAVWTGVYPGAERVALVSAAVGLPAHIVPLNVIPVGYPNGEHQAKDKWDESKVHWERYSE